MEILSSNNYVSTENMQQDFAGIKDAISLPSSGTAVEFQVGDILISNIRPYLKKIWLSDRNGGCSTDVLALRTKNEKVDSSFLYCCLANDDFVSYVMSGAKGVKMPRGDKQHILSYNLGVPSVQEQRRIAELVSLLEKRISAQSKIIEDKETLYKAIIDKHFKEIRKNESIQEVYLSNVFKERVEYSSNDGVFPHASLTKEGVNIKTDRYNRDFLVKDTDKQYKVTRINDICYNPANLKFGVITRNKVGTLIFSPIYVTFEVRNGYDPAYIELMVTNSDFVNKMLRFQEGTVYERMAVSSEDFLSESCKIPDLEIQKEFSAHVSIIEQSIQVEKKYLESICRIKNYILEAMFI